jgi:hypothetical protein
VLKIRPRDNSICYARPGRLALSAWTEHVPFAMYLVDLLRPASIVELGTRNGVSYSAFCQAVQQLKLASSCMAVDSWRGDAHTGAYGLTVLSELRLYHDPLYGAFSRLNQSTFDEAAAGVPNTSVDLLHIDGFHTYEAASHDYETWLPKVSSRGVVLFHDIAEHGRGFGVWKLWDELTSRHPSFAFSHGHGLGILGVGPDLSGPVADLFNLSGAEAAEVRRFFHEQGRRAAFDVTAQLASRFPTRVAAALLDWTRRLRQSTVPGR